MWGQRRKVKGRDTAGATGFKKDDLSLFSVKIMEIQRCPSPDVIKTIKNQ